MATGSSVYSMPALTRGGLFLLDRPRGVRDVDLVSQKSWKPSPVPGPSTRIVASGFSSAYSSATSDVIGSTVDEPEMTTSLPCAPATPANTPPTERAPTAATSRQHTSVGADHMQSLLRGQS